MRFPRCGGILLHLTSLPSRQGIGDLGQSAYQFAEFLAASGQKLWQVLPLSPTGYGDSPYQCFSAFAGNPLFIDLGALLEQDLLAPLDLSSAPDFPHDYVDYGSVIEFKLAVLRRAAQKFLGDDWHPQRAEFEAFCHNNAAWLNDYALFMACKGVHRGAVWTNWEPAIRRRDAAALNEWTTTLSHHIEVFKYWQFEFCRQWDNLKTHCHQRGIRIMGDIPIYVAHDSADVWAHPELFHLDEQGKPTVVAGVPPDYFIEAYWEVPADASTAAGGKWVKGPGAEFFRALQAGLGELPTVAENLGVITPEVEAIRKQFGFPGMSLLQFAFGNDPQGPSFRPHNYARELVAYTGGHDNDTTVGWWTSSGYGDSTRTAEDVRKEREFTRAYLGFENEAINWVFIRTVLASVADIAIIPLQDVLGLGSEARMNLPGTISGNWKWRYRPSTLTNEIAERLRMLTMLYDR